MHRVLVFSIEGYLPDSDGTGKRWESFETHKFGRS